MTLKVRNRAGKKSIIAPSFKGLNEGFHINSGAVMKITREFQSSEPLLLRAFDPDSHSAMMINNRKSIIVKPAKMKNKVTDIVIAPLSKWNIFLLQVSLKLSVLFLHCMLEYFKNDWCCTKSKKDGKANFNEIVYQEITRLAFSIAFNAVYLQLGGYLRLTLALRRLKMDLGLSNETQF